MSDTDTDKPVTREEFEAAQEEIKRLKALLEEHLRVEKPPKNPAGGNLFLRLGPAFKYAANGILEGWNDRAAFFSEAVVGGLLHILAFAMGSPFEVHWFLFVGTSAVLSMELSNTGLESVVDYQKKVHPLLKRAKDTASGAVLLKIIPWMGTNCWLLFVFEKS